MTNARIVLTTVGLERGSREASPSNWSNGLLAACVNIVGPIRSVLSLEA